MPNHVTCKLSAPAEVLDSLSRGDQVVDFNTVVPQPDALFRGDIGDSQTRPATLALGGNAVNFGAMTLDLFEDVLGVMRSIRKTGYVSWYEWNIRFWGTKWNAYRSSRGDGFVTFETAWSMPGPVLEALAEKFPAALLTMEWADEDFGSNCGRVQRGPGAEADFIPAGGSPEANRFAQSILQRDYLTVNEDGSVTYHDEDEQP